MFTQKNVFSKFRMLGVAAFLAMMAVFSALAMLLWNALMPDIFGLPTLGYLQALGLFVLARILFGGIGGFGDGRFMPHHGHGRSERLFHHGNMLREKWMHMSDEERKAFLEKEKEFFKFNRRCSHFHDFFDDRHGAGGPHGEGQGSAPSRTEGAAKESEGEHHA